MVADKIKIERGLEGEEAESSPTTSHYCLPHWCYHILLLQTALILWGGSSSASSWRSGFSRFRSTNEWCTREQEPYLDLFLLLAVSVISRPLPARTNTNTLRYNVHKAPRRPGAISNGPKLDSTAFGLHPTAASRVLPAGSTAGAQHAQSLGRCVAFARSCRKSVWY